MVMYVHNVYLFLAVLVAASSLATPLPVEKHVFTVYYSVYIVFDEYPTGINERPVYITGVVRGVLAAKYVFGGESVTVTTWYEGYSMEGFSGVAEEAIREALENTTTRSYPLNNTVPEKTPIIGYAGIQYYVNPMSLRYNGTYSGYVVQYMLVNTSSGLSLIGVIRERRSMRYDPATGVLVGLRANMTVTSIRDNKTGYEYLELSLIDSDEPVLEYYSLSPLVAIAAVSAALWGAVGVVYKRYASASREERGVR